jgi:hypothetical protein
VFDCVIAVVDFVTSTFGPVIAGVVILASLAFIVDVTYEVFHYFKFIFEQLFYFIFEQPSSNQHTFTHEPVHQPVQKSTLDNFEFHVSKDSIAVLPHGDLYYDGKKNPVGTFETFKDYKPKYNQPESFGQIFNSDGDFVGNFKGKAQVSEFSNAIESYKYKIMYCQKSFLTKASAPAQSGKEPLHN